MAKIDAELFISIAKKHGEDGLPVHETGDLRDLLRRAYNMMTPTQQKAFQNDDKVKDTVANAIGGLTEPYENPDVLYKAAVSELAKDADAAPKPR